MSNVHIIFSCRTKIQAKSLVSRLITGHRWSQDLREVSYAIIVWSSSATNPYFTVKVSKTRVWSSCLFYKRPTNQWRKNYLDCGATVHQNQCKDQLPADCTKQKHNSNKSSTKSTSNVSIVSGSGNTKRGSTASLPLPGVIGTTK